MYLSATPGDYELGQAGGEFVEQVIRPTGLVDPKVVVKPTKGRSTICSTRSAGGSSATNAFS